MDFIDFERAKTGQGLVVEDYVVSAAPGTLSLECTRLSQLTKDPKYYDAISRVMDAFNKQQNKTSLQGMWPKMISMTIQDVASGSQFILGGCADSLYEYVPKMYILFGGCEEKYKSYHNTSFVRIHK